MANLGSVFLGDFQQRHRMLSSSSSTPPSSPPPSSISSVFPYSSPQNNWPAPEPAPSKPAMPESPKSTLPTTIDPALALELRIRWLEALLVGVKPDGREKEDPSQAKSGESLARMAEHVQKKLDAIVEGNEGLKRFMNHYDQHAHLLTPSFALSGLLPDPPSYENMSPDELEAFLTEMEPDIRAADRDMREIEALESKGVTGAGKLADYEALQPRLNALLNAYQKDFELATSLEKRVASLMERHATHVDALSELFVSWDDTLTAAEDKAAFLEREREGRRRLGLE